VEFQHSRQAAHDLVSSGADEAPSAHAGASFAKGVRPRPVIDNIRRGSYLNRDLSRGAKKDANAVVFRAFVVVFA
jgi:hypothetical protein